MIPRRQVLALTIATGLLLGGGALVGRGGQAPAADGGHANCAASSDQTGITREHSHQESELHGGHVSMTKTHHFETVFDRNRISIYIYSADQAPMMVEGARGTITLKYKNGTTKDVALASELPTKGEPTVYFCPMHPEVVQKEPGICGKCGGMTLYTQNRLAAMVDLSKVAPGSLRAVIHIKGLGKDEPEVTFTEDYAPAPEKGKA
jgi:hypothetical protein